MGSVYTGNPVGTDAYNTAPAPNNDVKVYIPADTEPNNVATMLNQQYKALANNVQYLVDGYSSFRGTTSFKGLVINSTGAGAVTPASGTLSVSSTSTFSGLTTFTADPGFTALTGSFTKEYNGGLSTLNGGINSSVTTLTLNNSFGFWTGGAGEIKIDSEIIAFTAVVGNTLTGLTRGAESTTPASHSNNAIVQLVFSGGASLCPSPAAYTMYRELVPIAVARIGATGVMVNGFGIASITRIPNGNYDVTLLTSDPTGGRFIALGNIMTNNAGAVHFSQTSSTVIRVITTDSSWTQSDLTFTMTVYLS